MKKFNVPTREEVSTNNQAIFDNLKIQVGFVPNLYATMAYSETALGDKVIMNYLHNLTNIPMDFPIAKELELVQS